MSKVKSLIKTAFTLLIAFASIQESVSRDNSWTVSTEGTWRILDDYAYYSNKGSASNLLTIDESVKHRHARLKIQKNIVDSYIFGVGCILNSKTPILTLRVPPLDIDMLSYTKGYVYARFLVDQNDEISMRANVNKNGSLIFTPFTKSQDEKISNLFLQLREGGVLKIALLQGENVDPRLYDIPLTGFFEFSDSIVDDCKRLNAIALQSGLKFDLMPDYLSKEPEGLAPLKFSLKFDDDFIDKKADIADVKPKAPKIDDIKKPESLEFTPDGSPATIGPDGLPVGAFEKDEALKKDDIGKVVNKTMHIDLDGNLVVE